MIRHLHDWRCVDPSTGLTCRAMSGCYLVGFIVDRNFESYVMTNKIVTFDGSVATTLSGSQYRLRRQSSFQQDSFPGTRLTLVNTNPPNGYLPDKS